MGGQKTGSLEQGGSMDRSEGLALWYALGRLMADYWAEVDESGGRLAHEFYLPDAVYVVGNQRFEGREKIAAFYERRRHATIATRHIISNLRAFADDASGSRVAGLMSLYRADGKSPFQGARPPTMIADFEASCMRCDDGRWRFQSHVLRPFIIGSDLPASVAINPRSL
jgi:hypothetical protein